MKPWVLALLFFALVTAVGLGKMTHESRKELAFAQDILEQRKAHHLMILSFHLHWFPYPTKSLEVLRHTSDVTLVTLAVKHLRRAFAWDFFNLKAKKTLYELAEEQVSVGEIILGLQIFEELRSSLISTQVFSSNSGEIRSIESRMQHLGSLVDPNEKRWQVFSVQSEGWFPWKFAVSASVWLWIGSVFLFIWKSGYFEAKKKPRWGYFAISFVLFFAWVFSLSRAGL